MYNCKPAAYKCPTYAGRAVPTIVRPKTNGRNSRPIGLLALLVSFKGALFKQRYFALGELLCDAKATALLQVVKSKRVHLQKVHLTWTNTSSYCEMTDL